MSEYKKEQHDNIKNEYIECFCNSPEHRMVFSVDHDFFGDDEPVMIVEIYMGNWRNFFKRVWVAVKYIFGYKCKYGHFNEFEIDVENAEKLINLAHQYIANHKKWEIKNE